MAHSRLCDYHCLIAEQLMHTVCELHDITTHTQDDIKVMSLASTESGRQMTFNLSYILDRKCTPELCHVHVPVHVDVHVQVICIM